MSAPGATAPAWRTPVNRALLALALLTLLLRLATLGSYPLMDTSEARYGEIARVMLTTGNFVTLQEVPQTPFWAKPPLYAWLSVASMRVLGTNEFALRLPSFACALVVLALCWGWARSLGRTRGASERTGVAVLAVALLATSVLFFVSAGAVMTDPSLAACITAMLAAFHHTVLAGSRRPLWRYGFFVAAGLAMLAKGPVLLLYAGAPIALWTLWQRRVAAVWQALPWVGGTVIAALICLPWYALAEARTPGFLQYFLVGEHVMRFIQPGWGGDRYGTAHAEPLGMIWVYFAAGLGTGVVLALAVLVAALRRPRDAARSGAAMLSGQDGAAPEPAAHQDQVPDQDLAALGAERRFLLLSALVPAAFFTFAGNIIWTYNLPALGPLAVLLADFLAPRIAAPGRWRAAVLGSVLAGALVLAVATVFWAPRHVAAHSSAGLVARWQEQDSEAPGQLVYLGRKTPASLRYYSRGAVTAEPDLGLALGCLERSADCYLALPPARLGEVNERVGQLPGDVSVQVLATNTDLVLVRVHAASLSNRDTPRREESPPSIDPRHPLDALPA